MHTSTYKLIFYRLFVSCDAILCVYRYTKYGNNSVHVKLMTEYKWKQKNEGETVQWNQEKT